ncbi:MAG: nucleoside deaminase [Gemmataceae bacterium]
MDHKHQSRRRFLSGCVLGGLVGAAASWSVARFWTSTKPLPAPVTDGERPVVPPLDHDHFMRLAIEQAKKVPQLPFGAVLAHSESGQVMAAGHNLSAASPTFHGEIVTINRCAADHPHIDWPALVLYTTAEPCPMCQSAVEWAGISAVVYGISIPRLVEQGWWQIDIRAEEVIRRTPFRQTALLGGVLESECNALFLAVPEGMYRKKK